MFQAHDAILAVDIGGTNIRAGVVQLNLDKEPDLSKAKVWKFELWRHGDEKLNRDEAVDGLTKMLRRLINRAKKEDFRLAPFIGIGCPGRIDPEGAIEAALRIFREIGKAVASICLRLCTRQFLKSVSTRRRY
jgi:predicted NBD/HSP70 family sugar kinase